MDPIDNPSNGSDIFGHASTNRPTASLQGIKGDLGLAPGGNLAQQPPLNPPKGSNVPRSEGGVPAGGSRPTGVSTGTMPGAPRFPSQPPLNPLKQSPPNPSR